MTKAHQQKIPSNKVRKNINPCKIQKRIHLKYMIKRTIELCMERKYNHDVGYLMIGNGEDISEKNIDVGEDEGFN